MSLPGTEGIGVVTGKREEIPRVGGMVAECGCEIGCVQPVCTCGPDVDCVRLVCEPEVDCVELVCWAVADCVGLICGPEMGCVELVCKLVELVGELD